VNYSQRPDFESKTASIDILFLQEIRLLASFSCKLI